MSPPCDFIFARAFDLPTVNLAVAAGFDPADRGHSRQDISIDYVQTHNQRVIQTGGVRNAFSMDELIGAVNDYLRDPSLDAEGRAEIREVEAGPFTCCTHVRLQATSSRSSRAPMHLSGNHATASEASLSRGAGGLLQTACPRGA